MRNYNIDNPVYKDLKKLKLVKEKELFIINKETRDKKINVLRDKKSKIIFLQNFVRNKSYYINQKGFTREKHRSLTYLKNGKVLKLVKPNFKNKKISLKNNIVGDDIRRFEKFKKYLNNKKICDFGCGYGGFLSLSKKVTKKLNGVELNTSFQNYFKSKKKYIEIREKIGDFKEKFDVITMFHVLEHLPNQIDVLKNCRNYLKKKGKIIIEVPHAKDFLIDQVDIKEFKNFIFWSEHLVLHTKKSLHTFLKKSGFRNIKIEFCQRYGFTNHLNWILNKKPGGHETLKNLYKKELDLKYKIFLENMEYSDTIIAIAER